MNKRGFTLSELTVVLIIMGVLLGVALKGRDVLVTAKERQETGRINKLQIAYTTAYSRLGGRPELMTGYGYLDMEYFKEEGLLEQSDINSNIQGKYEWGYLPCGYVGPSGSLSTINTTTNRDTNYYAWINGRNSPFNDMFTCVSLVRTDNFNKWGMGDRMMCLVERDFDDNDTFKGRGRFADGSSYATNLSRYDSCRTHPVYNTLGASSDIAQYLYRID